MQQLVKRAIFKKEYIFIYIFLILHFRNLVSDTIILYFFFILFKFYLEIFLYRLIYSFIG